MDKMNEGLWDGIVDRGTTGNVRKEDELDDEKVEYIKKYLFYTYNYNLTYKDKNDVVDPDVDDCCDSIEGFYKNPDSKDIIAHIRRNWSKGKKYHDYIRDKVNELRSKVFDMGFKKKPGESISDTLYNWWDSIDDNYSKVDILLNHDVDIKEDEDPDDVWDDLTWKEEIEIYLKENGINEGLWDDIVRRGTTGEVRKEDVLSDDDRKILDSYIEGFGVLCSGQYEIYKPTLGSFVKFTVSSLDDYPNIEKIKNYVIRNWDKGENIMDKIKNGKTNEALVGKYEPNDEVKEYIDNEVRRIIEDNDLEIEFVGSRLYGSRVRGTHRPNSDLDYVFEYRGRLKEFVVFNIMHEEEHFIDNIPVDINPIRKEESGTLEEYTIRVAEYVKECDVAAPNGGLVFGDIQGMGPITFPGECGEKGSGDLPMPSGRVYQQVAPFDSFIKTKKKKKRKKFRKEDEPCVHSDNPPVYSYVDDFREYVDRTYNKIK